jgi:PKD repeat protein
VDFSASQFCLKDTVRFSDLSFPSANDTLVNWQWAFGDGDSSKAINPSHAFSQVDSFLTILRVTTNTGCSDTASQMIRIQPKPTAWFGTVPNCAKTDAQFIDSSTISRGVISQYEWNFGDPNSTQNTSNVQDPRHRYDTLGNYLVTLIVESDQAC